MTVPTVPPTAVRSTGNQTSTASRTPSPTGTYTDWRRRDVSTITPWIFARAARRIAGSSGFQHRHDAVVLGSRHRQRIDKKGKGHGGPTTIRISPDPGLQPAHSSCSSCPQRDVSDPSYVPNVWTER